ncbi:TPA: EexN family lipoprotein [Klebsiella pneumoniae]
MKRVMSMAAATLLAACNPASDDNTSFKEPVQDVPYYLNHPDEREAQIDRCKNNPGELADTPNCKNAIAARAKAMTESTEMPSIR